MKIEKIIQDDHQAKLIVEIEQEQMEASKRRAARRLSERGKIPGFRPGKAPYPIVVRHYGEQVIVEEALDLLVDEIYPKILEEAQVEAAGPGTLESIDSLEPPKLTFRVPLIPEVDLGDYRSIRLPYQWTAPDNQEVETALQNLRLMYATTEPVEREIQLGDYVLVDIKASHSKPRAGDQDRSAALSRQGFALMIREEEKQDEWPFPGFSKELLGLKAGESKTIKHKYPKDDQDEALRGETVTFEVTVKAVRGVLLPELDDEFAKMTGIAENLDGLRQFVTRDLESRSQAEYDDQYFEDLIEKIKEGATIKYAPYSLNHETEHVLEDLQQRLAQQGLDLDTYLKMRNLTREQFIKEEVRPVARKRLERSLILDEIIRRENIQVDDAAVNAQFNQTLDELQSQGLNFEQFRSRKDQQRLAEAVTLEAYSRVLTRRALDVMKSIATGKYQGAEASNETTEETTKPRKKATPRKKADTPEQAEKKTVKKAAKKSEE
ncbi:MAG: trigger factor [Anaerolineae bacterium]